MADVMPMEHDGFRQKAPPSPMQVVEPEPQQQQQQRQAAATNNTTAQVPDGKPDLRKTPLTPVRTRRRSNKPKPSTVAPSDLQLKKVLKMAKQKAVDEYEIGKTLGEGRYGKVKMGHHIRTGKKVAVKILTKSNIKSDEDLLRIQRETKILTSLHHENIIRVYDVYETPTQIFIIMEFAEGGDLYTYLVTQRTSALTLEEALPYFRQMVSAMLYCHARFVVHRDLKPENILLDKQLKSVKIADFGFSRTFSPELNGLQTSCGSLYYAAPEILEGKKYVGPEVDVWSLGVILYVMLTGEMPFEGGNDHELARNIKRGKVRMGPIQSCDPTYAHELTRLVCSMLTVDPSKRMKLADIQVHPSTWLDKPLLASLVIPFAKKLSYSRKQSEEAQVPVAPLTAAVRSLRTSNPSHSPAIQRSFSADIGPSPFISRANPPVSLPTQPAQLSQLSTNSPRRLLRQTSGPMGGKALRTSGSGIPTGAPRAAPYPSAVTSASRSPPTSHCEPMAIDVEAGKVSPLESYEAQPTAKKDATPGFSLPAGAITIDDHIPIPPSASKQQPPPPTIITTTPKDNPGRTSGPLPSAAKKESPPAANPTDTNQTQTRPRRNTFQINAPAPVERPRRMSVGYRNDTGPGDNTDPSTIPTAPITSSSTAPPQDNFVGRLRDFLIPDFNFMRRRSSTS